MSSDKPTTVTLDTNVPLELLDKRDNVQDVEQLLCLAQKTEIDLAVTTRIRADTPHDPWKSQLRELFDAHGIKEIGSVTRLDYWVLGVDRFPSERFLEAMSAIRARRPQVGKNKLADVRDWDHLHGHYLSGRDVFLTWDTGILDLGADLCAELNLMVMKPDAFLANHLTIVSPEVDDTTSTNRERLAVMDTHSQRKRKDT